MLGQQVQAGLVALAIEEDVAVEVAELGDVLRAANSEHMPYVRHHQSIRVTTEKFSRKMFLG